MFFRIRERNRVCRRERKIRTGLYRSLGKARQGRTRWGLRQSTFPGKKKKGPAEKEKQNSPAGGGGGKTFRKGGGGERGFSRAGSLSA